MPFIYRLMLFDLKIQINILKTTTLQYHGHILTSQVYFRVWFSYNVYLVKYLFILNKYLFGFYSPEKLIKCRIRFITVLKVGMNLSNQLSVLIGILSISLLSCRSNLLLLDCPVFCRATPRYQSAKPDPRTRMT